MSEAARGTVTGKETENIIIAVLFAFGGAVEVEDIALACDLGLKEAREAAGKLKERLDRDDGALVIKEFDGKYQLGTNPKYFEKLISVVSRPKKPELSDVLLETLAIIASKSPATRLDVERIRGVKSDFSVNRLVEYGLIEECGRLNVPGRPVQFRPTAEFCRRFGLRDAGDLPDPDPEPDEGTVAEAEDEVKEIWRE